MEEKVLEIDVPILISGVVHDQDQNQDLRWDELEIAFLERKGILKAHVERDKSPAQLCLHYDPAKISISDVRIIAQRAGTQISNRYRHEMIPVEGMDCSDCSLVLEHSLGRIEGVLDVNVSYVGQTMHLEFDSQKVTRKSIENRVRQLGYRIPSTGVSNWYQKNRELVFSLLSGILLLIGWSGKQFFAFPELVSTVLFLGAFFSGGYDITRHAMHALRERHFDTDLLMLLAALGAAYLGEFAEGALLLFLFSFGHALEERALDKARNAIRALADLTPNVALVRKDGQDVEISVQDLEKGDRVIIRPGERVSMDGEIIIGKSSVDQSPVTGESVPVEKKPSDIVFAGSVNGEGVLEIRVTKLAKDSTLSRVIEMVEKAQAQKSPTQLSTERFTKWFVPSVLIADVLLIAIPPLLGASFEVSFLRAMTLLVAASPCALALGTPSAILAGAAQAARNGVLVKGGLHLENLGNLQAVAFDKTGTLTEGKPRITDIVEFSDISSTKILMLAAALEIRSAHPLAEAIKTEVKERNIAVPEANDIFAIAGRGIQGEVEGQSVWIGNLQMFNEGGIKVPDDFTAQINILANQGKSNMLVGLDQELVGVIATADKLRPQSSKVLSDLAELGIRKTIMLTGDNQRVASQIAKQAGLTDFRADLLPEDKLTAIKQLVKEYGSVAMVGDGVNDAPALANATVGIAMGGASTDVALETADIALMADDLSGLTFAIALGRATRRIIKQNLMISFGVIATLVIASLLGIASIGTAIVFHEGSTIVVVLNALRLLSFGDTRKGS